MRLAQPRLRALADLVPPDVPWVVDVGCDHGHLSFALGAVGVERTPRSLPERTDIQRVVADGLKPFREVPCAVIAGMGARSIIAILEAGPRPGVAIVHATDDPEWLRVALAARGWRLDRERLVGEGNHISELIRVVPGAEPSTGLRLRFGPRLLEHGDPLLSEHIARRLQYFEGLATVVVDAPASRRAEVAQWRSFLTALAAEAGL